MDNKKRGRKPKNEYYMTKGVDNVSIENQAIIITLPVILEDSPVKIDSGGQLPMAYSYNEDASIFKKSIPSIPNNVFKGNFLDTALDVSKPELTTDIHCFWCCHQFVSKAVFMPINLKGDTFLVRGVFCSFECCMAYVNNTSEYKKNRRLVQYLFNYSTKTRVFREKVKPAPPRELLKMFGGALSIEEFRAKNNTYKIHPYPMKYTSPIIERVINPSIQKESVMFPIKQTTPTVGRKTTGNSLNRFLKKV